MLKDVMGLKEYIENKLKINQELLSEECSIAFEKVLIARINVLKEILQHPELKENENE